MLNPIWTFLRTFEVNSSDVLVPSVSFIVSNMVKPLEILMCV